jgi:hypothetical protein
MKVNDFLRCRRDELRMFFELRFGRGWHTKIYPKIGGWMTLSPSRLARAEDLARLQGFVPRDERPCVQSLERNFLARLRIIAENLNRVPAPICHKATLGDILEEFFAHRPHRSKYKRKHKEAYSDVIPLEMLVFEGSEQRTKCPSPSAPLQAPDADPPTLENWLSTPIETLPASLAL